MEYQKLPKKSGHLELGQKTFTYFSVNLIDGKDATLVLILEFLSYKKNREIIALEHTDERR